MRRAKKKKKEQTKIDSLNLKRYTRRRRYRHRVNMPDPVKRLLELYISGFTVFIYVSQKQRSESNMFRSLSSVSVNTTRTIFKSKTKNTPKVKMKKKIPH